MEITGNGKREEKTKRQAKQKLAKLQTNKKKTKNDFISQSRQLAVVIDILIG